MSRRRPLHKYPEEYYELFEQAQREPFTLDFESHARARSVRAELYNLRACVREAVTFDPDESTKNSLAERYLLMENVIIELENNTLHFRVRNYVNAQHVSTSLENALKGK